MSAAFDVAWNTLKKAQPTLIHHTQQKRLPGFVGRTIPRYAYPDYKRNSTNFQPHFMQERLIPSEDFESERRFGREPRTRLRTPALIRRVPAEPEIPFQGRSTYQLEDHDGDILSYIEADRNNKIRNYYGHTDEAHRRQGHYRTLIENLLRHGFDIESDSRNEEYSDPFHRKFIQTLPPDIRVGYHPQESLPGSTAELLHYTHVPEFHDTSGQYGDLKPFHRTQVPFVDENSDDERPKTIGIMRGGKHLFRNRDIVVPGERAREILARPPFDPETDNFDWERRRTIDRLRFPEAPRRRAQLYDGDSPNVFTDETMLNRRGDDVSNPTFGSKLYAQTALPLTGQPFQPQISPDSVARENENARGVFVQ